ncbi:MULTISPECIES: ABC transporter transmembrane domain-containing protein [unclassified Tateyamaria]|uniref:ABC transporter transmembrane domain-containing protein n=1 Tax=unclassified Tateyamaria TaxID=2645127 RepID=UPI000D55ADF7|nr:ABC transporter transmembrane domain-containing protein [Tateyamaria sp. Alg231-49]
MIQLYAAIWRVSGPRQIVLILLSVAIAALAAAPLKFQQDIVNLLTYGPFETSKLFLLGGGMMAVILVSLGLKWVMGYRSQLLGEDVIRLIRSRLLIGAANEEKSSGRIRTGTLSTAISAEAEELGKFTGGAFSEPVMQVGTLISVIGFVASTQPGLGLVALSMIAPQVIIVLLTQRKVNALLAERVRILRCATDQITATELKDAVQTVLGEFDQIYNVRRTMFRWKVSTKFLLSSINGAGTVLVFMLGGAMVIDGKTDVGTVVAATLGLSRLQGPTTYLISFYREVSSNRVKFELLRGLNLHQE